MRKFTQAALVNLRMQLLLSMHACTLKASPGITCKPMNRHRKGTEPSNHEQALVAEILFFFLFGEWALHTATSQAMAGCVW